MNKEELIEGHKPKNPAIEALKEGEYYTVFNYVYENREAVMVGFVTLGNNGDNGKSDGSLRGKATFASEATKDFSTNSVWCYKDKEGRDYKLSTPEEIEWLKECIRLGKYIPKPEKSMKQELSSLPEKWCIKPNDTQEAKIIGRWFDKHHGAGKAFYEENAKLNQYYSNAYNPGNVYFHETKKEHGEEITFEQFKKWVLKEGEGQQKSEPIMNTYGLNIGDKLPEKIINEWCRQGPNYSSNSKSYWHEGAGCFSGDRLIKSFGIREGVMSFEVSNTNIVHLRAEGFKEFMDNFDKPKQEEKAMFKKGDYIVTLKVIDWSSDNCAKDNYCFKQRIDAKSMNPEIDLSGSEDNWHSVMSFNKKGRLLDWRYATLEEIVEYDRLGKPYDVSTLKTEKSLAGRWLKALVDHPESIMRLKKGEFAKIRQGLYFEEIKGCGGFNYSKEKIGSVWELMPEGFNPELATKVLEIQKTPYKFKEGDEVQVCRIGEDVNGWGFLGTNLYTYKVQGVAGNKGKIEKIKKFQGRWYYKLSCHLDDSYISEDCLTLLSPISANPCKKIILDGTISVGHTGSIGAYTIGMDPYHKEVFPREKLEAQLVKLKQCKTINPDVNNVKSVETKLIKPKKIILF